MKEEKHKKGKLVREKTKKDNTELTSNNKLPQLSFAKSKELDTNIHVITTQHICKDQYSVYGRSQLHVSIAYKIWNKIKERINANGSINIGV